VITHIPFAEEMGPKWGLNQLGRPKNLQEQLLSVVPQLHHLLLPAMKRINYICTSKLNEKILIFQSLVSKFSVLTVIGWIMQLVLRSGKSETIPLLDLYASMAWIGTNFPLLYSYFPC
jgi:hypothetical protein